MGGRRGFGARELVAGMGWVPVVFVVVVSNEDERIRISIPDASDLSV